jgi:hypothetical protein
VVSELRQNKRINSIALEIFMQTEKLDQAITILEDVRRLHSQMNALNTEEGIRSREFSLAITEVETAKLWLQEVVVKFKQS